MPRSERLSVLDELFLHLEGPDTHMHVGGVAVFEGPTPSWAEMLAGVESRLHLVPRFRQKLLTIPYGLGRPVWVERPHFNLSHHLRQTSLEQPGDEAALKELVAQIMSQQLDRAKPLWEMWLVEGVADDRFAVISKTHHCVVDGVSGTDIMSVLMDPDREARKIARIRGIPSPNQPQIS